MDWRRILAYGTGIVDQEVLLRNEHLTAENRILRAKFKGRLKLSDLERKSLSEIGKQLGRKALQEVAQIATADKILGWHRALIARKFNGSKKRHVPGQRRRLRNLSSRWPGRAGPGNIAGSRALWNLGIKIPAQTVGNILERHDLAFSPGAKEGDDLEGINPIPLGRPEAFDFFTAEVLTLKGLPIS